MCFCIPLARTPSIWHSLPIHNCTQPEDVLTRAERCSYVWVFGNKGAASDAMYWYLYAEQFFHAKTVKLSCRTQ